MRRLTESDIQKELETIGRWPTNANFALMKNLYDQRSGYVLKKVDRAKKPIEFENASKKGVDIVKYDDLEAAVRAGWVVD